MTQMAQIGADF